MAGQNACHTFEVLQSISKFPWEEIMTDLPKTNRRGFLAGASLGGAAALVGGLGIKEAAAQAVAAGRSEKPLKAAACPAARWAAAPVH